MLVDTEPFPLPNGDAVWEVIIPSADGHP